MGVLKRIGRIPMRRVHQFLGVSIVFTIIFLLHENVKLSEYSPSLSAISNQLLHAFPNGTDTESGTPFVNPEFDSSLIALFIEPVPNSDLAALTLHHISVLPPTWRLFFLGSEATISLLRNTSSVTLHEESGKLIMQLLPQQYPAESPEEVSQLLTTPWLYSSLMPSAEWVLMLGKGTIMCSNSAHSIDELVGLYDWIGQPGHKGAGSLSLRRVRALNAILQAGTRTPGSKLHEDEWFISELANSGFAIAPNTMSALLGATDGKVVPIDSLNDGEYTMEMPMGYSTGRAEHHGWEKFWLGDSKSYLEAGLWGTKAKRDKIWEWCPEVKIVLLGNGQMDAAQSMQGDCGQSWGKGLFGLWGRDAEETEEIEEEEVEEAETQLTKRAKYDLLMPW